MAKGPRKVGRSVTNDQRKAITRLATQGESTTNIANKVGICSQTVRNVLKSEASKHIGYEHLEQELMVEQEQKKDIIEGIQKRLALMTDSPGEVLKLFHSDQRAFLALTMSLCVDLVSNIATEFRFDADVRKNAPRDLAALASTVKTLMPDYTDEVIKDLYMKYLEKNGVSHEESRSVVEQAKIESQLPMDVSSILT